jgi:tetratricopeptide (TPR) repeat protein
MLLAPLLALSFAAFPGCARRVAAPAAETAATAPQPTVTRPPEPAAAVPAPPPEAPPAAAPLAPPPPPEAPPAATAAHKAYAAGLAALQEGGHQRALELFAAAMKEKPAFPEASRSFDEALVAVKKGGDAVNAQGKPEEAGRRWMAVLRQFQHPAAKGKTYAFTRAEVQGQVDRLTAAQMEKGLLLYRKGEIPAAIACWKTILAYDPENEEAARSIRTASTQLENLKKIPPVR